ncbi:MAG: hypothetical protein ACI90V_005732, partial [Bacillariaceae sp.]
TILFSTILDHFDDPSGAKALFARHTRILLSFYFISLLLIRH